MLHKIFFRIGLISYSVLSVVALHSINYTQYEGNDFIVRWEFQRICDHVFDPRTVKWAHPTSTKPGGVRCNPKDVKPGDTIFVRDIELFFQEMHPRIKAPYIIVTHGEYRETSWNTN